MWSMEIFGSMAAMLAAGFLQAPVIKLHALSKRLIGSLIFLLPAVILMMDQPGIVRERLGLHFHFDWDMIALVSAIVFPIAVADFFLAGDKENTENYPPIRSAVWSPALLFNSLITWTVFLFCYEMIFRGVFLFAAVEKFGLVRAVLFNTLVYSLVHLLKSKREALVSIPMGLIFCYIALSSGSFWYAAMVHIALALNHEICAISSNPGMRFDFSLRKNRFPKRKYAQSKKVSPNILYRYSDEKIN